jgi:alginate O-acetyltransferase complex protein AlgI
MRFDSLEFVLFFLVVFGVERCLGAGRARLWLLLLASYAFYASWSPPFLLLLWFSTLLDFRMGHAIAKAQTPRRRKLMLALSLVGNLGMLAYFKYDHFFTDAVSWVGFLPQGTAFPRRDDLIIPLGISFYTFQTMSYTLDVYRKRIEPCRDLLEFSLFVSFFPQLIAGPIMRAGDLIPQIRNQRRAEERDILIGVELFCVGAFKKVVIADNVARLSDACFGAPGDWTGGALALGLVAYACQFYCDFSGYSTMARGLGRLLGFDLPRNFDAPLLSRNPWEFRQKWHMTMSQWFLDYVYRPLGRRWHGTWGMSATVVFTWLLFALWHGPTWNFLVWGLVNGVMLAAYRLVRKPLSRIRFPGFRPIARWGWLLLMIPSLAIFRANNVADVQVYLWRLVTLAGDGQAAGVSWFLLLAGLFAFHAFCAARYKEDLLTRVRWPARMALVAGSSTLIALFSMSDKPFIYFQF